MDCIFNVLSSQSLKSDDLRERLVESEKLMNEMGKTWEDKLMKTERKLQVCLGGGHSDINKTFLSAI